MNRTKAFERPFLMFIVFTHLLFWVLLGITGAATQLNAPGWLLYALPFVCAWTSTFVFLIFYKKLVPGMPLGEFVKRQFSVRLNLANLSIAVGMQVLIFVASAAIDAGASKTALFSAVPASFSVLAVSFIDGLFRGPLGEELGWRGFAFNHLQKKHSPLAAGLIVGAVWGSWHAPLWFLTSGYSGAALAEYCLLFMAGLVSLSVIMAFFYNRNRNLVVVIVLHQMFNFLTTLAINAAFTAFVCTVSMYVLFAALLVIVDNKQINRKPGKAVAGQE